ncbi:hypothetical protein ACE1CD_34990 [Aerosakkonema sp. BLCC-F183]|uniref:hypothetical protein n=1 Tax=Aerosakkonema sp. BLCC-F183 TaxID=3342834 RepID=UPI0035BAE6CF
MFKWLFNKFKYLQVEQNLKRQNQSLQLLEAITLKICQSLNLEDILQTAVTEVRQFLRCDRLLVYRLWLDGTGSAVAESVDPKYLPILGKTFPSEVFPVEIHQQYCQGHIKAIGDIKKASISKCLIEFLQQFNVKRIVGSLSDITGRKQAEHQLHLLESVVVNGNDAVVITEAEPINEPGPRILSKSWV